MFSVCYSESHSCHRRVEGSDGLVLLKGACVTQAYCDSEKTKQHLPKLSGIGDDLVSEPTPYETAVAGILSA